MKQIILLSGIACLFFSCNDSFLDREPTHDLNDASYWKTAEDLKTFNNGIYNIAATNDYEFFSAYSNNGSSSITYSMHSRETQSDNAVGLHSSMATWANNAAGLQTVPVSGGRWTTKTSTSDGYWGFLRRCNMFLQNYQRANILEETKNNYAGEVYFWRAWCYLDLMQYYGDVPFINIPLDTDSPELHAGRDPRTLVADSILADINRAIAYLPSQWNASNPDRVTKWTALALKSRICLYEGTYRTYHGMSGAEKFLNEAVSAAQEIINSGKYSIYSTGNVDKDLWTLFNSQDLSSNSEVILRFIYETPGIPTSTGRSRGIYESTYGLTKDLMDDFLCIEADGTAKPITLSDSYDGTTLEGSFDNRDPRMGQTALDPRREQEFAGTNLGTYPGIDGSGPAWKSKTGYHIVKFFNIEEHAKSIETDDYPVIRYAEVLLNYAEAKAVLGTLTQSDLDISINKLRDRVQMPHLTMNPVMDPKYANEGISALMVEIRRERRIELACENFRYQDLMRWKKGAYMTQRYLGIRVNPEDVAEGGRFATFSGTLFTDADGVSYIDAYAGTNYAVERRSFDESKHYLFPIPTNVLTKNSNLKQNPGWE